MTPETRDEKTEIHCLKIQTCERVRVREVLEIEQKAELLRGSLLRSKGLASKSNLLKFSETKYVVAEIDDLSQGAHH